MQFYKKTSIGKSYNYTSLIIKIILVLIAVSIVIFFVGKINFPAPNKLIKQEIKNAPINMYKALKISIIIAPRLFCMMFLIKIVDKEKNGE